MTYVDNMMGERIDTETTSVDALEEALELINKYYPADKSTGLDMGVSYWQMMRDAVVEIEEELELRASEEDALESRADAERDERP